MRFRLPLVSGDSFSPSELKGSVAAAPAPSAWKNFFRFAGPGLLVSVGYMDPGNWATDLEAGSRFGYNLLFVVLLSSLAAILLQCLSLKLGIVAQKDLAQVSRDHSPKAVSRTLWVLAEIAIIACDLAEVLGGALAFHLLFGCTILEGVALTALDTLIVLGLRGKGFRQLEAIILGLILTIGACFAYQLFLLKPDLASIGLGLIPAFSKLQDSHAWYLAVGILGATVMPHNLYLHSSIVQTRILREGEKKTALKFATLDTVISLSLAFFVNAAILIVAASAFHGQAAPVTDIRDAYHLLEPVTGTALASILFGVALLAAGQSSTFTGTIAGQVIMEGFLNLKIKWWLRRIITRALALVPAFIGVSWAGDDAVAKLLVLSQVVLSFQLPFAIYPLIKFTSRQDIMGEFKNRLPMKWIAWSLFAVISSANLWLVTQFILD